jgi:glycerol transport system ATP-binding protein
VLPPLALGPLDGPCTIGIRTHELSLDPLPGTVTIPPTTSVAEVT